MTDLVRITSLNILNKVSQRKFTLDYILNESLGEHNRFDKRDKSLLNTIVYGVLRWRNKLDWIISEFSKTPLKKMNTNVKNILRMGIFQICFLDKIPDSASVNTSVDLTKQKEPRWITNFVNGVLRSVSRKKKDIKYPSAEDNYLSYISVVKSFPEWLIKDWLKKYGFNETITLCDFINTIPPLHLRTNTLKITREKLICELGEYVNIIEKTDITQTGITLEKLIMPFSEMIPFKDGYFQVQDEASQLVTEMLNPKPGEHILDACAGLGTKSGHIAQHMKNTGSITATDITQNKLDSLNSEMNRLGFTIVKAMQHNHLKSDFKTDVLFDKILVDAPCSGSGVLRRNPDSKWTLSKKQIKSASKLQLRLLNNIKEYLKPGGILTYSVCSTEQIENEDVISKFIKQNENFKIIQPLNEIIAPLLNEAYMLKINPLTHKTDGFFAVCLKKCF